MRVVKYLFAVWTGVLIYTSISLLFGAMGFSAYRQLQIEEAKQEANIKALQQINMELEATMNSLLFDQDTITIFAREQGYVARGERFIRIAGLGFNQRVRTSPGEFVPAAPPQYFPNQTIRLIALGITFAMIVSMAVFDVLKYYRERV